MIGKYDLSSIAFCVVFIIGVVVSYARNSKDASDYFWTGGVMVVAGWSIWIANRGLGLPQIRDGIRVR